MCSCCCCCCCCCCWPLVGRRRFSAHRCVECWCIRFSCGCCICCRCARVCFVCARVGCRLTCAWSRHASSAGQLAGDEHQNDSTHCQSTCEEERFVAGLQLLLRGGAHEERREPRQESELETTTTAHKSAKLRQHSYRTLYMHAPIEGSPLPRWTLGSVSHQLARTRSVSVSAQAALGAVGYVPARMRCAHLSERDFICKQWVAEGTRLLRVESTLTHAHTDTPTPCALPSAAALPVTEKPPFLGGLRGAFSRANAAEACTHRTRHCVCA